MYLSTIKTKIFVTELELKMQNQLYILFWKSCAVFIYLQVVFTLNFIKNILIRIYLLH